MRRSRIDINELDDFSGTLLDLKRAIDDLIEMWGEMCIISVDAGYDNVSFFLEKYD